VIGKETDLPEAERWPDYHSLPLPQDTDGDGTPDFWERQFGLDPADPQDSARLSRSYANVEHYFNSTNPTGNATVVYVAAAVSRTAAGRAGQWRIMRNGDTSLPLTVHYRLRGDAQNGKDFRPLPGSVTIEAGKRWATVSLETLPNFASGKQIVLSLICPQDGCKVGCPAESLMVLQSPPRP
jgi:hypothetical protein